MEGAIMWGIVIFLGLMAFRYWAKNPPRPSLNWETSEEEALEAAQFCAYQNRRNRSHLSLVSGGSHGNRDFEAFQREAIR